VTDLIVARGLSKAFGSTRALDNVNFHVQPGRIVGLIGPNGAGKTTALKALLGLTRFDRAKAEGFLARTTIPRGGKIQELSKGMVTQLHLALVMAIDARLLVLDEPTLGLDILFRKQFYDSLLSDYFDGSRTILVTTHQVDEIQHVLTDVMFIDRGRIVFARTMEEVESRYREVAVRPEQLPAARALNPIHERQGIGRSILLFEAVEGPRLASLGEVRAPSLADLFVAVMDRPGQPQGAAQ